MFQQKYLQQLFLNPWIKREPDHIVRHGAAHEVRAGARRQIVLVHQAQRTIRFFIEKLNLYLYNFHNTIYG